MSKEDVEFIQSDNQVGRCGTCGKNRKVSMPVEFELDRNAPNLSDIMKLLYEMIQESKDLQ